MKIKDTRIFKLFSDSFNDFNDNECMKLSASLSYCTIFALPSFAIILITFLGYFLGEDVVSGQLYKQINKMVGDHAADQIQEIVENSKVSKSTIIDTIVGFVTLLVSATGMFGEIQSSINDIWNIDGKPKKGFMHTVVDRFFSFSMIVIFGLILIISLLIDSFVDMVHNKLDAFYGGQTVFLADMLDSFFVFLIMVFLLFYIFKELPDGEIKFKETLVGALFTAVLFMIGKWGIGIYLDNSDNFSLYGTAGSILMLLLWVYYTSLILYFGAVFVKNYALLYGTPIVPDEFSEFKTKTEAL